MPDCGICGGLHYVVTAGKREACRCVIQSQLIAKYPFLRNPSSHQPRAGLVKSMIGSVLEKCPARSDLMLELNCRDSEMWMLLASILYCWGVGSYALMDLFELCDIVYMRHPKWDSFWGINEQTIVVWTGFNTYSTHNPGRLAQWSCQLWDKARANRQNLLLLVWGNEAVQADIELWRQYASRRGITALSLPLQSSVKLSRYV